MKTVSDIGERGLIKIISEILGGLGNDVLSGEDDAVAIKIKYPSTIVINTDMLVSTTDVPPQMNLFQAARKAVVMTVSDVLVKGAIPKWAVVALGVDNRLPITGDQGFMGLIQGLKAGFKEYGIQYLGGDLNETKETIISCTIFGEAPYGIISRSGASPGDYILTTGEMGKTGCGFSLLLENMVPLNISEEQKKSFINSIMMPHTPPKTGIILASKGYASASCDSSDGILKAIQEICEASDTGAEIYWDSLPISSGVINFSEEMKLDVINLVLKAGEEFLHIFVVPSEKMECMQADMLELGLTKIGIISKSKGEISLKYRNKTVVFDGITGYEHFK
jgi:thiamine-monophosphate kinase